MENKQNLSENEQIAVIPDAINNVDKESTANSFGKFKTKEEMLAAYSSLEAEFTRRSQKIKELETIVKSSEEAQKWQKRVDDLNRKYPVAKELTTEIASYIEKDKEILKDEGCLEKALLNVLATKYMMPVSEKIQAKTTDSNVKTLINEENNQSEFSVPESLFVGGDIPINPPYRPKTIAEAGELAKRIIKN